MVRDRRPVRRYTCWVTAKLRRGVTVRRFSSNAEADRHDLDYWKQIPPADRVRLAWTLSVEQWQLAGRQPDEPGLCRSVARVHRR
ncbi:MAG: hypothetical protein KJ061_19110 [Vicinamibacteraceae bacterium]|nr:hypothetical protein [Vicinamibacteraceae bacterium]